MKSLCKIWITLLLAFASFGAMAQDEDLPTQQVDPKVREKVDAARIALITNRLGLTPDQAEKFWPIYNEFINKRKEIRQEFRTLQQGMDPANPDPKKEKDLVNLGLQIKQKELNLEKDYSDRILSVITAQQMLNLRKAEQDFRQLILNQLQQRSILQQRKELLRDKNQRLHRNKK